MFTRACRLTKGLGANNLIGSSGEFGLLFAFLTNSPKTTQIKTGLLSALAISVEDVRSMFVDHVLPAGWQSWKKSAADWAVSSAALASSAAAEYVKNRP